MRKVLKVVIVLCAIHKLKAFDLQCQFKSVDSAWSDISYSGCDASNVNIQERNQKVSSVNNLNANNFAGSTYKIIKIVSQSVNYFPQDLGKFFPEIEEFWIQDSKLNEIEKKDLAQFPKLKRLALTANNLQFLPADLFEGNSDVEKIHFNFNPLKFVGLNILSPLKKLDYARFTSCGCVNAGVSFQSGILDVVSALQSGCFSQVIHDKIQCKTDDEQIKVKDEKIKYFSAIIDATADQLSTCAANLQDPKILRNTININCRNNEDDDICEAFDLYVNIFGSEINEIRNENGSQRTQPTTKLLIDDQKTFLIPSNLAEKLPQLTEISITNSGLSRFDSETFAGLTALTSMNFSNNKLTEIPENSFVANANLRQLDLSFNRISKIAETSFAGLVNLLELNLQNNLLTSFNAKTFNKLASLEVLTIFSNKISTLPSKLFYPLPEISTIDISNNAIEKLTGDLVSSKNKIKKFVAAANKLNDIEVQLMRRLMKSELIDFSGNVCINETYTTGNDFDAFHMQIYLRCNEEDEED